MTLQGPCAYAHNIGYFNQIETDVQSNNVIGQ